MINRRKGLKKKITPKNLRNDSPPAPSCQLKRKEKRGVGKKNKGGVRKPLVSMAHTAAKEGEDPIGLPVPGS